MKKTILTLAMMLMMAFAATAEPANPANVALKGDSMVITGKNGKTVTVSGVDLQRVNEKINEALDDTLTPGDGTHISVGHDADMTPEDVKAISDQWAKVAENIAYGTIWGLLALVLIILLFRYLNRRNKYRVIEKAIENNYPLNDIALTDVKRSAIYVQQPVVTAAPSTASQAASQPGEVPVGAPIQGQTPVNPIVTTNMINWRALMPAIRPLGWGAGIFLFGWFCNAEPFAAIGLAFILVGVCKGFILYKEQKALEEAWKRTEGQRPRQEPMREGIPVPPPLDNEYKEDNDENTPYQPY